MILNNIFESSISTIEKTTNESMRSYNGVDSDQMYYGIRIYRYGNLRLCYTSFMPLKVLCTITLDSIDLPSTQQSIEADLFLMDSSGNLSLRHGGFYIDPTNGFNVNPYSKSGYYHSDARDVSTITSTGLKLSHCWFMYYV